MSQMNELSQTLDELTACGQRLIETASVLRAMFTGQTEPEQPPAPQPKEYTFVEVRKAFAAKSHAGHTQQVKALITKYGAEKLSAVKPEDYPALMAELEAIK